MSTKLLGLCALTTLVLYVGLAFYHYSALMSGPSSSSGRAPRDEMSSRVLCKDDLDKAALDFSSQRLGRIAIDLDSSVQVSLTKLDLGQNALSEIPADIGRLTSLRVLNLAGNALERLPDEICALEKLEILGLKSNKLSSLPECIGSLKALRALFLTDNRIADLPKSIGELESLKKLQAASNSLTHLPAEFARLKQLELFRCPGNRLQSIPPEILEMPMLMWLSFSNNPYTVRLSDESPLDTTDGPPLLEPNKISFRENLADHNYGGASSSGVLAASLVDSNISVVAKMFRRGDEGISPDGRAEDEINILSRLSTSDSDERASMIPRILGLVDVDGRQGLIMRRVANSLPLGMKPIDSIKMLRCRYNLKDFSWTVPFVTQVVIDIATALTHCHSRFISHGDVYAHNILIDRVSGRAYLTDFGAAFMYPRNEVEAMGFERIEVRAFGVLLGELVEQVHLYHQENGGTKVNEVALSELENISRACTETFPRKRPLFHNVIEMLSKISH